LKLGHLHTNISSALTSYFETYCKDPFPMRVHTWWDRLHYTYWKYC